MPPVRSCPSVKTRRLHDEAGLASAGIVAAVPPARLGGNMARGTRVFEARDH